MADIRPLMSTYQAASASLMSGNVSCDCRVSGWPKVLIYAAYFSWTKLHKPYTKKLYYLSFGLFHLQCNYLCGSMHSSLVSLLSSPQHLTGSLLAVAFLASFGSSMLYGYNLAVVNSPAEVRASQSLVKICYQLSLKQPPSCVAAWSHVSEGQLHRVIDVLQFLIHHVFCSPPALLNLLC